MTRDFVASMAQEEPRFAAPWHLQISEMWLLVLAEPSDVSVWCNARLGLLLVLTGSLYVLCQSKCSFALIAHALGED